MPGLRIKIFHLSFAILFSFSIFMAGCAGLKETTRGIIGISTREIENNRKYALKKEFNYDYETCYNKTLKILKYIEAYIYTRDQKKNLLAIYVSSIDTTSVGIYFTRIDAKRTRIEVSSASTYAKELIAEKLFLNLEKPPRDWEYEAEEEEG